MPFDLLAKLGEDQVMREIFSEKRTISDWLAVEAAHAQALAEVGIISPESAAAISEACRSSTIDSSRLWAEMRNVGYPILPLVKQIVENTPNDHGAWVHYGATTQDIMDSALALQLRDAIDRLLELAMEFGDRLAALVAENAATVMPGRTHAQQAVPTTLGLKMGVFLDQLMRDIRRIRAAREDAVVVSLFGAGGTSAALGHEAVGVRTAFARILGLTFTDTPWHVARDRVAALTQAVGLLAGTCIRLAREIVDLSRTEIREVAETAGKLRGASSTMPQKANPISCEAIIGFGVIAQVNAQAMLRALEAGHERAAGEWQIEWRALPTCLVAAASAVATAAGSVGGLQIFRDRMRQNLEVDHGSIMAESCMIALAKHLGRDRAHDVVYDAVRAASESNTSLTEALERRLPEDVWRRLAPSLPSPDDYLGDSQQVSESLLEDWASIRTQPAEVVLS